jgi:solute carrier family 25 protein 34/35
MNPSDIVAARLYNQPVIDGKGQYYEGPVDALSKIVKKEGVLALWKGLPAHCMRVVPHTILTYVFLEFYTGVYADFMQE